MSQFSNPSGPLMVDLKGLSLDKQEISLLQSEVVGGVILFSRNYASRTQLAELVAEIRSLSPDILIAVDHEGGRVQRFREGFTRIPPMAELGKLYQRNQTEAIKLAKDCAWLLAAELIAVDIDISFTPVLDRDCGVSDVIGDRAFGASSEQIITLTQAFIDGMHEAGMAATGKHYPGHGAVAADSHTEVPVDGRSYQEIADSDLLIFSELCHRGLDALMPAHVVYEQCDAAPAGFSEFWLQRELRGKIGFDGVVFSDDLGMEGASVAGSYLERADAALAAGCDMVLVCNKPEVALEVCRHLESTEFKMNQDSARRLGCMHYDRSKRLTQQTLASDERWLRTSRRLADIQKTLDARKTQSKQVGEP